MVPASAHKNEMGIAAYADGQQRPVHLSLLRLTHQCRPNATAAHASRRVRGGEKVSLALLARMIPPPLLVHPSENIAGTARGRREIKSPAQTSGHKICSWLFSLRVTCCVAHDNLVLLC